LQWQHHGKRGALANGAGDVDAAMVVFHDAAGEGQSQAGAFAFGRVKRAENVGQMVGRDAASVVRDFVDRRCALGVSR
jgi:hypothetical protein